MNSNLAIRIDNLCYSYTSEWTFRRSNVLQNISLDVTAGETFGFLGHNGAGKTTTIKCMLGLVRPRSGDISIFGTDFRSPSTRAMLGYLPEQPYFYEYLTVEESMRMYACLVNIPRHSRNEHIRQALERVKLFGREKTRVRTLSKGLMQRLAMAQAICHNPKLLILDEPFSGLDPIGRREFRELLVDLKKDGTTIFLSSHILSDVEFLCDRVSILSGGELKGVFETKSLSQVLSGHFELILRTESMGSSSNAAQLPSDVTVNATSLDNPDRFFRLTFDQRESAQQALKAAIQNNLHIESFEFIHGNLEDLFMRIVSPQQGREQ